MAGVRGARFSPWKLLPIIDLLNSLVASSVGLVQHHSFLYVYVLTLVQIHAYHQYFCTIRIDGVDAYVVDLAMWVRSLTCQYTLMNTCAALITYNFILTFYDAACFCTGFRSLWSKEMLRKKACSAWSYSLNGLVPTFPWDSSFTHWRKVSVIKL